MYDCLCGLTMMDPLVSVESLHPKTIKLDDPVACTAAPFDIERDMIFFDSLPFCHSLTSSHKTCNSLADLMSFYGNDRCQFIHRFSRYRPRHFTCTCVCPESHFGSVEIRLSICSCSPGRRQSVNIIAVAAAKGKFDETIGHAC